MFLKIIQNKKKMIKKMFEMSILLFFFNFGLLTCYAVVMQGTQYSIEFDSLNTGGNLSTSTDYSMEDSIGEIATGYSSSTSYSTHAGFQQQEDVYLTITAPTDITLTPLSVTQNSAVGSASWTVVTNNSAGYTLNLNADTNPALTATAGKQFTDLKNTPETWSVSNAYKFGFSIYGADVSTAAYGTDTDCINTTDVPSATLKWRGFTGATPIPVVYKTSPSLSPGSVTTMCVATEQNTLLAPSGTYSATITATAVPN